MEQRLQVRHVKRQLPRIRSHTEPRVESHISYKKHRSKVNSGFVPLLRVGYGLVSHVPHGPARAPEVSKNFIALTVRRREYFTKGPTASYFPAKAIPSTESH